MNTKNKASVIQKLSRLLNEERSGLILIDGPWGAGKTYFIDNDFNSSRKDEKTKPLYIISALGIEDLNEFKSKLFYHLCLEANQDLKTLPNTVFNAIAIASGMPEIAGNLKDLLDIYYKWIYEKEIFTASALLVIDDIERINEKLANEILHYCHSVYVKNNNMDFIVISNLSEESNFSIDHKEKIISDTISFSHDLDDIMDIFSDDLKSLSPEYSQALKNTIKKHKIKNIRIIHRIVKKITPIFEYHGNNPEKELRYNHEMVISCISSITILHSEHHFDFDSIKEKLKEVREKDDELLTSLYDSATAYNIPDEIKKYALNILSVNDATDSLFHDRDEIGGGLKLNQDIIYSETNEDEIITDLIFIMTQKNKTSVKKWLEAIEIYGYLTKNHYASENNTINHGDLFDIADKFTAHQVRENFTLERYEVIDENEINNARNKNNFSKYLELKHAYDKRPEIISKIREDILTIGWSKFNTDRLRQNNINAEYRPIKVIGSETIMECILEKWSIRDIHMFSDYLHYLRNSNNAKNYILEEEEHLQKIANELENYKKNNNPSFRYGAVLNLLTSVDNLIKLLSSKNK
ncbi:P-loop NTPase fold protein [Pectobacterium sp. CHL-2024]|uniref:P-loop NTPase fold protein n=1 Tax=Pectobacterium sp. CHL-2024 TaxID=3377079 RepID=UPI0038044683